MESELHTGYMCNSCLFGALLADLVKIYVTESPKNRITKIGTWLHPKVHNGKLNDIAFLTILSSVNLEIFQYKV
jgi:hypothetical protein